jgi:hypothetical protein
MNQTGDQVLFQQMLEAQLQRHVVRDACVLETQVGACCRGGGTCRNRTLQLLGDR